MACIPPPGPWACTARARGVGCLVAGCPFRPEHANGDAGALSVGHHVSGSAVTASRLAVPDGDKVIDEADEYLRSALATANAFGWTYHRATTLLALAQNTHRRLGRLDDEGRAWLAEASALCRAGGFRHWIAPIEALEAAAAG